MGIEMGNPKEIEQLLKNGDFLDLNLDDLRKLHAELVAFNTVIDRKLKAAEKIAERCNRKFSIIANLVRDPNDLATTVNAIRNVIERTCHHD